MRLTLNPTAPISAATALSGGRVDALPYAKIFDAAGIGITVSEASGTDHFLVSANPAFCALTGYSLDEVIGQDCRMLQGALTDATKIAVISASLRRGEPARQTLLNYRKDGSTFWNEITIAPLRDEGGVVTGFVGFQSDVSDRIEGRRAIRTLERRLQTIADNLPGFIFQRRVSTEGATELTYCSPSLNRLLELPEGPITYEDFLNFVHPEDLEQLLDAVTISRDHLTHSNTTYRLVALSGREVWIRSYATVRATPDGEVVWDGCALDITSERQAQDRLVYLSNHDPISGLLNRGAFEATLARLMCGLDLARNRAVLCAVAVPEIRDIREALGVPVADALTQALARRLSTHVRSDDQVSRMNDTQFAVLAIQTDAQMEDPASKLFEEIRRPFRILGHVLNLNAYMGVALHSDAGIATPEMAGELIKRAEIALHEAVRHLQGGPVTYSREIDERVSTRVQLRHDFRHALALKQFSIHYQPLVDLSNLRIVGAEALLRWRHPTLGEQSPAVFIPLAEETGFIVPLGEWVMEKVMHQASEWDVPEFGSPRLAINVSGIQIQKSDFFSTVQRAIASSGVNPRQVELELTETCLIDASGEVAETIAKIRKLGISLAIDDFGTGYASYQNLKTLAVDKLKLDQGFVRNLGTDPAHITIVHSIITMAKSLGLDLVAEGIETIPQLEFLKQEGCSIGQGYLFAEPVTADEFEAYLTGRRTLRLSPNWSGAKSA